MKRIIRLVVVAWIPIVLVNSGGCGGGLTQKEMMRHAIRRSPADEEEPNEASLASQKPSADEVTSSSPAAVAPTRLAGATPAPPLISSGLATKEVASIDSPSANPPVTEPEVYRDPEQASRNAGKTRTPEESRRQANDTTDSGDGATASQIGHDPLADLTPVDANIPLDDEPRVATEIDETKSVVAPNVASKLDGNSSLPPSDRGSAPPGVVQRHAVPSDDALTESRELLRELFQAEYKAAATQQARQTLLKRMLDQLKDLGADIAGQYALLDTVRQISVQSGAVETALQAVDELSARFEIDSHATKLNTLVGLSRSAARQQAQTIVQASTQACQEACLAENYDVADQFCGLALVASQKTRNMSQTTRLQRLRQEVQAAKQSHRMAERAMSTLDENPNDERAATMLGKYLCFVRQDWSNGLPILARGDDPRLTALAKRERDQSLGAEAQAMLGDAWWQVAEKASPGERRAILSRAAYWYRLAIPTLPHGLARVKTERRLRQFEHSFELGAIVGRGIAKGS